METEIIILSVFLGPIIAMIFLAGLFSRYKSDREYE